MVQSGMITTNQKLLLGPDTNGAFIPVTIPEIRCKMVVCQRVQAGQMCTFAIQTEEGKMLDASQIRKSGTVMLSPNLKPAATYTFEAELVTYDGTTK